jgi:prevent-host-death family protein
LIDVQKALILQKDASEDYRMQISVRDAQNSLGDLLDRAEQGEDIYLTRDGRAVARLVSVNLEQRQPATTMLSSQNRSEKASPEKKLQDIAALQERVRQKADPFPEERAENSQDFLYDDDGLPR